MGESTKSIELYTHYITPIFTKLNLLGLLHAIFNSSQGIPRRVSFVGYNYVIEVMTYEANKRFIDSFSKAISKCGEEFNRAGKSPEEQFPYNYAKSSILSVALQNLINISLTESEFNKILREQYLHDRRSKSGKAPPILLAPDLGKFTSAKIPYEAGYPNAIDARIGKAGLSLCTAMALLGFEFCSFRLGIPLRGAVDSKCVVAFPSTKTDLDMVSTRILYWIGRRFEWLTRIFNYRIGEQEGLSISGLYALLSPIIKDVSQSVNVLSKLELIMYAVERDVRRKQWTYARSVASIDLEHINRLPDSISGAMLAKLSSLKLLVEYVPEFFNVLGEYLLSGNDVLYVEALRSLASVLHRTDVSSQVKSVASFILEHGTG